MNLINLVFADFKGQLSFILVCKLYKSPYLWLMFGTHYTALQFVGNGHLRTIAIPYCT